MTRPPYKYVEANVVANALNVGENIESSDKPTTYTEAVSCNDFDKWMISIYEDVESLHKNSM